MKPFKLPKFVKLGAYKVPVIREEIDAEIGAVGYFCFDSDGPRIVIDSRLKGTQLIATFVHEVLHAGDQLAGTGDMPHKYVYTATNTVMQAFGKYLKF